uniref:G protein-coupled receptor n=1 Tax=Globodera rostochiensis TaxID=31243 RepID=A0A914H124_GLORO
MYAPLHFSLHCHSLSFLSSDISASGKFDFMKNSMFGRRRICVEGQVDVCDQRAGTQFSKSNPAMLNLRNSVQISLQFWRQVLYVPCIYSIWKHMRDNSCYKLLFYIGITDLGILWIPGLFSGWANLRGAVFCSYPTLMYFVGMASLGFWGAETTADLILAFNRCLDLVSPRFAHILFSGPRTSLWITGCSLYALYWALFMKPVVYSSIYFAWFFYPFADYRTGDDQHEEYEHWLHRVHNIAVAFLSPLIYLIFAAKLFYDVRKSRRQFGAVLSEMGSVQIRIFIQVFFVSLINTLTGFLYVYIQNNEVNQWMITLAEFAWF